MPATSAAQRKFMGMVHATQKHEIKAPSSAVAKAAKGMSAESSGHFAKTKEKGLPEHVKKSFAEQLGLACGATVKQSMAPNLLPSFPKLNTPLGRSYPR